MLGREQGTEQWVRREQGDQVQGCCYDPGEGDGGLDQGRRGKSSPMLEMCRNWSQ